jgi:hypothetical protein
MNGSGARWLARQPDRKAAQSPARIQAGFLIGTIGSEKYARRDAFYNLHRHLGIRAPLIEICRSPFSGSCSAHNPRRELIPRSGQVGA